MAIDFDTTRKPIRPIEWLGLLDAVLLADPNDESVGLEWKGTLDLLDNNVLAHHVARAILGMANRSPEDASRHFGGSGIFLAGLEPGAVRGVEQIDPASLDQRLAKYVGAADGPRFEPRYFTVQGKDVLTVEVLPPAAGDRIFALRSAFTIKDDNPKKNRTVSEGTVWVRRGARTDTAKQGEFDMLLRRGQTSSAPASLDVEVMAEDGIANPYVLLESNVENWLDGRRRALLQSVEDSKRVAAAEARAAAGIRRGDFQAVAASLRENVLGSLGERVEETRTEEAFGAEVDQWIKDLREAVKAVPGRFGAYMGLTPLFKVRNRTEENFQQVRVVLSMEGDATVEEMFEEPPMLRELLPPAPRSFGAYYKPRFSSLLMNNPTYDLARSIGGARGPETVRTNGGSFTIETVPVDLRPGETELIESESVILIPEARTDPLTLHWRATATNVRGVAEDDLVLERGGLLDPWAEFLKECEEQGWPNA